MVDPVAFRSDQLPTEHFNERFSDDNIAFWVPILVEAAQIMDDQRVLDVGCGTGGFSHAVATTASARVTGLDYSPRFIEFAQRLPLPEAGAIHWQVGGAEHLPFTNASFERVLLSLVLHQLARPATAVFEAFRVLVDGGIVLVRTIAPTDVGDRVPERYVPTMAAADAARMPSITAVQHLLEAAGFELIGLLRVIRNKRLDLRDEERQLLIEARSRYKFVSAGELEEGLRLMRADAQANDGNWIDPRPTYVLTAMKPSPATPAHTA